MDLSNLTELITTYGVRVIGVIVFLIVARIVAAWAGSTIEKSLTKKQFDLTLTKFFAALTRTLILVMAVLACLGVFGIETTSFAAILGAGAFAIGLAFQGTLGNFASGVLLLVFRPYSVGDVISAGGQKGKVEAIGLFTTTMDTPDNRRIIVPNSAVTGGVIENISFHKTRRVDVAVGTDYGADLDAARDILEKMAGTVPGVLADPAPQIFLESLGDSCINWQVRVWCNAADYWNVWQATTLATKKALDGANIGIPFPQMDVHVDGKLG
jgi:small conductance mechanosensitive channel